MTDLLCASASVARLSWQPIETAPKDGTRLWLFYPTTPADDRQKTGWWEDDTRDGPRWMDHADSEQSDPTHWMPLPPPPVGSGRSLADATTNNPSGDTP